MSRLAPTNSIQAADFSIGSEISQQLACHPLPQEHKIDTGRSHLPHKDIPGWPNIVQLHLNRSFFLSGATIFRRVRYLTTQFAESMYQIDCALILTNQH